MHRGRGAVVSHARFAWRPTHATGCARQPFVACECMCFPRRGIDASPTIVMVEGRFGLFAMGVGRVVELAQFCAVGRSEEHPSEPRSLLRRSYDVFCLKKKHNN